MIQVRQPILSPTEKRRRQLAADLLAEAARHEHMECQREVCANMARMREALQTRKRLDGNG